VCDAGGVNSRCASVKVTLTAYEQSSYDDYPFMYVCGTFNNWCDHFSRLGADKTLSDGSPTRPASMTWRAYPEISTDELGNPKNWAPDDPACTYGCKYKYTFTFMVPPGEEVYYRFARGKKNHAYTNKHASEINEGDGGSGGWIMHLENIPKECDESNFGLATLTSASGYTTPTLDFFGHEVGGNDYHASKGDWDWKTGTFHEGFPVNKKYDVLKARKIVALQSGIMRVPGTAVAHCMPNYEPWRRRDRLQVRRARNLHRRERTRAFQQAQDHERRCPALLGAERAHGPDRVLRMSDTASWRRRAQRALWMGVPLWEGVRRVHCRRTELPLRRRAARALRKSQPEERPR
jgi:hypothetical protein